MTAQIEVNGRTFAVEIESDSDHGAPWAESDGHGAVTEWLRRDKKPGELVLSGMRGGLSRFYDFAGAVALARRDGWGSAGDDGLSPGEKAEKAARADFDYLQGWAADRWEYVGVTVCLLLADGSRSGYTDSLWGVESLNDYPQTVALELAQGVLKTVAAEQAEQGETVATGDGTTCPACGSADIEGDGVEIGEGAAVQDCRCLDCPAVWSNRYTFAGSYNVEKRG